MDFHQLPRRQLQSLCKKHGIPANSTNTDMADALSALLKKQQPAAEKATTIEKRATRARETKIAAQSQERANEKHDAKKNAADKSKLTTECSHPDEKLTVKPKGAGIVLRRGRVKVKSPRLSPKSRERFGESADDEVAVVCLPQANEARTRRKKGPVTFSIAVEANCGEIDAQENRFDAQFTQSSVTGEKKTRRSAKENTEEEVVETQELGRSSRSLRRQSLGFPLVEKQMSTRSGKNDFPTVETEELVEEKPKEANSKADEKLDAAHFTQAASTAQKKTKTTNNASESHKAQELPSNARSLRNNRSRGMDDSGVHQAKKTLIDLTVPAEADADNTNIEEKQKGLGKNSLTRASDKTTKEAEKLLKSTKVNLRTQVETKQHIVQIGREKLRHHRIANNEGGSVDINASSCVEPERSCEILLPGRDIMDDNADDDKKQRNVFKRRANHTSENLRQDVNKLGRTIRSSLRTNQDEKLRRQRTANNEAGYENNNPSSCVQSIELEDIPPVQNSRRSRRLTLAAGKQLNEPTPCVSEQMGNGISDMPESEQSKELTIPPKQLRTRRTGEKLHVTVGSTVPDTYPQKSETRRTKPGTVIRSTRSISSSSIAHDDMLGELQNPTVERRTRKEKGYLKPLRSRQTASNAPSSNARNGGRKKNWFGKTSAITTTQEMRRTEVVEVLSSEESDASDADESSKVPSDVNSKSEQQESPEITEEPGFNVPHDAVDFSRPPEPFDQVNVQPTCALEVTKAYESNTADCDVDTLSSDRRDTSDADESSKCPSEEHSEAEQQESPEEPGDNIPPKVEGCPDAVAFSRLPEAIDDVNVQPACELEATKADEGDASDFDVETLSSEENDSSDADESPFEIHSITEMQEATKADEGDASDFDGETLSCEESDFSDANESQYEVHGKTEMQESSEITEEPYDPGCLDAVCFSKSPGPIEQVNTQTACELEAAKADESNASDLDVDTLQSDESDASDADEISKCPSEVHSITEMQEPSEITEEPGVNIHAVGFSKSPDPIEPMDAQTACELEAAKADESDTSEFDVETLPSDECDASDADESSKCPSEVHSKAGMQESVEITEGPGFNMPHGDEGCLDAVVFRRPSEAIDEVNVQPACELEATKASNGDAILPINQMFETKEAERAMVPNREDEENDAVDFLEVCGPEATEEEPSTKILPVEQMLLLEEREGATVGGGQHEAHGKPDYSEFCNSIEKYDNEEMLPENSVENAGKIFNTVLVDTRIYDIENCGLQKNNLPTYISETVGSCPSMKEMFNIALNLSNAESIGETNTEYSSYEHDDEDGQRSGSTTSMPYIMDEVVCEAKPIAVSIDSSVAPQSIEFEKTMARKSATGGRICSFQSPSKLFSVLDEDPEALKYPGYGDAVDFQSKKDCACIFAAEDHEESIFMNVESKDFEGKVHMEVGEEYEFETATMDKVDPINTFCNVEESNDCFADSLPALPSLLDLGNYKSLEPVNYDDDDDEKFAVAHSLLHNSLEHMEDSLNIQMKVGDDCAVETSSSNGEDVLDRKKIDMKENNRVDQDVEGSADSISPPLTFTETDYCEPSWSAKGKDLIRDECFRKTTSGIDEASHNVQEVYVEERVEDHEEVEKCSVVARALLETSERHMNDLEEEVQMEDEVEEQTATKVSISDHVDAHISGDLDSLKADQPGSDEAYERDEESVGTMTAIFSQLDCGSIEVYDPAGMNKCNSSIRENSALLQEALVEVAAEDHAGLAICIGEFCAVEIHMDINKDTEISEALDTVTVDQMRIDSVLQCSEHFATPLMDNADYQTVKSEGTENLTASTEAHGNQEDIVKSNSGINEASCFVEDVLITVENNHVVADAATVLLNNSVGEEDPLKDREENPQKDLEENVQLEHGEDEGGLEFSLSESDSRVPNEWEDVEDQKQGKEGDERFVDNMPAILPLMDEAGNESFEEARLNERNLGINELSNGVQEALTSEIAEDDQDCQSVTSIDMNTHMLNAFDSMRVHDTEIDDCTPAMPSPLEHVSIAFSETVKAEHETVGSEAHHNQEDSAKSNSGKHEASDFAAQEELAKESAEDDQEENAASEEKQLKDFQEKGHSGEEQGVLEISPCGNINLVNDLHSVKVHVKDGDEAHVADSMPVITSPVHYVQSDFNENIEPADLIVEVDAKQEELTMSNSNTIYLPQASAAEMVDQFKDFEKEEECTVQASIGHNVEASGSVEMNQEESTGIYEEDEDSITAIASLDLASMDIDEDSKTPTTSLDHAGIDSLERLESAEEECLTDGSEVHCKQESLTSSDSGLSLFVEEAHGIGNMEDDEVAYSLPNNLEGEEDNHDLSMEFPSDMGNGEVLMESSHFVKEAEPKIHADDMGASGTEMTESKDIDILQVADKASVTDIAIEGNLLHNFLSENIMTLPPTDEEMGLVECKMGLSPVKQKTVQHSPQMKELHGGVYSKDNPLEEKEPGTVGAVAAAEFSKEKSMQHFDSTLIGLRNIRALCKLNGLQSARKLSDTTNMIPSRELPSAGKRSALKALSSNITQTPSAAAHTPKVLHAPRPRNLLSAYEGNEGLSSSQAPGSFKDFASLCSDANVQANPSLAIGFTSPQAPKSSKRDFARSHHR